jgi:centromeric protein E
LRVSYLEIYNEVITDLLNTENTNLKIHETMDRGIFVGGLTETVVCSWEQVCRFMRSGEGKRRILPFGHGWTRFSREEDPWQDQYERV